MMIYSNIFTLNQSQIQIPSTTANIKWCECRGKLISEVSKYTPVVMFMMLLQRQNMTLERTTAYLRLNSADQLKRLLKSDNVYCKYGM